MLRAFQAIERPFERDMTDPDFAPQNPISQKLLDDLEWPTLLAALAERARTDLGRARCLSRPFLPTADEARESLAEIDELGVLTAQSLSIPSWGVRDIRPLIDRAAKGGTLEAPELLACAAVLDSVLRVKDFIEERADRLPRAAALAERIAELDGVAKRIERAFEPNGELADRASPELRELRERARGLHRGIKARLDQLLHTDEFVALLRENYFTIRNERYVVPVVANFRSQVPGIVHNASQSGQTLFIEPEQLIGLGNELAIAQSMVLEEERRILQELSALLGGHGALIEDSLEAVAELDAREAAARLAADLGAHAPEIVRGDAPFALKGMRHPLLVLQGKDVVANDASLGEGERVLVISGPNAGGKTVTMTAIGLSALLLRAGLPVPAERGSTLPFFNRIMSAVGDKQDLSRDLSTFSAHLVALDEITRTAGRGTLVLIDEIAADTDPREGAAIALAVLEELAARGARVLVTTHLEELKAVALTNPQYVNARVEFDTQRLAPTYRVKYGTPGSSSAIEIARRVGLDPRICDKAEENLAGATGPLGQALAALEEERAAAARAKAQLEEARRELERQQQALEEAREAVRRREREIEAEARKELIAEVERSRAEVAQLIARLQAAPTVRAAVETQERLEKIAREEARTLEKARARETVAASEEVSGEIKPGMRVKVLSLNQEGQVLEIAGEMAVVAAGPMKLRQKLKDLVPLKGAAKTAKFGREAGDRLKAAKTARAAGLEVASTRVDVRGMRADDALKMVETFLDRCYGEGLGAASILHGLGTGALRASIREYLKDSPYVKSFRSGDDHEGGGGVTVVELKG